MRRPWPQLIHALIVLAMPLFLLAVAMRVPLGHWFVRWEYNRPGFPADPYGLSTAERIRLAEASIDYLTTGAGIELLESLELEGGPAFNAREMAHMVDVQRVLGALLWAGTGAGAVAGTGVVVLARQSATRPRAAVALLGGSLLSLGLLVAVGALMLVRWDVFFVAFHELLFQPGTWTFPYSDTLIRLTPVRFWIDVAIVIVGAILVQALAIGTGAALWLRSLRPTPQT